MITEGYIKIWRVLLTKPIWLNSTSDQRSILIAILGKANWQENKWEWKGKPYQCMPGEFISSYKKIAKLAGKGVTDQKVRTAIKRFKNLEFLTYLSTNGWGDGIKVIITNWEEYQKEINRPVNRPLTDNQQTINFSLTTNEEHEEYKNITTLFLERKNKFLELNPDFKIFGEYQNVFLTEKQYQWILARVLNHKKINEYIENLSKNIASAKDKDFDFEHLEMHKIRVVDYFNAEKRNRKGGQGQKQTNTTTEEETNYEELSADYEG